MKKKVIIQFTGAQGSGKTTLVQSLKSRLSRDFDMYNIPIIGEVSRSLVKGNVIQNLDVEATLIEQMLITAELLQRYFKALNTESLIILAERTAICCMAYCINLTIQDNPRMVFYVKNFTELFMLDTVRERKDVDIITFYIEPLNSFEDDGVRKKQSQNKIDKTILDILGIYKIPFTKLNGEDTVEQRVDIVIKNLIIEGYLNNEV